MRRVVALLAVVAIAALAALWLVRARDRAPARPLAQDTRERASVSASGVDDDAHAMREHELARAEELPPGSAELDASASTLEPAASHATTPPDEIGIEILARVLDDRRRPVAGARVELLDLAGEPRVVENDAEGRARFVLPPENAARAVFASLVASDGLDRAAVDALTFVIPEHDTPPAGARRDAGDLVLGPAGPVEVRVREQGRPAAGARVRVELGFHRLVCGAGTTDASGTLRIPLAPLGTVHASARTATATGRARSSAQEGERVLAIDLVPSRAIHVVVVEQGSGLPIEGARVLLEERAMPPTTLWRAGDPIYPEMRAIPGIDAITDAKGSAVLESVPRDGELRVRVEGGGIDARRTPLTAQDVPNADRPTLRFEVLRVVSLDVTIPIVAGELPVPADGTPVRLREIGRRFETEYRLPSETRVQAGALHFRDVPAIGLDVVATTDDGGIARVRIDDEDTTTTFVRARAIRVTLVDASGAPLAGAGVRPRNQGNAAIGDWVATDEAGVGVIGGLFPGLVQIFARGPASPDDWGQSVATADVTDGDREITAELPGEAIVALRLWIDGEARLPARLHTFGARVVRELPDEGRLWLAKPRDPATGAVKLDLLADGFVHTSLAIGADELARAEPIDVHLVRAGELVVRVDREPRARVSLGVERWSDEESRWAPTGWRDVVYPNAEEGRFVFDELAPGRVRVLESASGATSEEIDLAAGQRVEVVLDLLSTGIVRGRVVAPSEEDLALARVLALGEGAPRISRWDALPGLPPTAHALRSDGSFELRLPVDGSIELRAWHPWLRPAEQGGTLRVERASDGVVLRLEAGPSASFAVPAELARAGARVRVLLDAGEPDASPLHETYAPITDGRARFGGHAPGRYTLWLEPAERYAPLVVRDIELGAGDVDLGAPPFALGSSVSVRLAPPAGQDAPRVDVFAVRAEAPVYARELHSRGERELVLSGLGPGTWRLRVSASSGSHRVLLDRELTLDGEHDEIVDVEVR